MLHYLCSCLVKSVSLFCALDDLHYSFRRKRRLVYHYILLATLVVFSLLFTPLCYLVITICEEGGVVCSHNHTSLLLPSDFHITSKYTNCIVYRVLQIFWCKFRRLM